VALCLVGGLYYPGYALYILEIFLPGLGLGEVLSLWKREDSLAEKLGLAFGLGLAFDTLVLAVRTSGVSVLGENLRGVDLPTIYFILAAGSVALAVSWLRKKRLDVLGMPAWSDLAVALLTIILGTMAAMYFAKYPIFPAFASQDPGLYTGIAQGLVSGAVTSLPGGVLYYGVHLQLASSLLLVGGEPLVAVQRTMGVLVVLSPLVVYAACRRIFASSRAGLVTVTIYVLSGTIWFDSVFDAGLYANFFGILASLFFVVAFLQVSQGIRSIRSWLVFSFALFMVYLSHYSSVTVFPALLILPLVAFALGGRDVGRYLIPGVAALVPAAVALVAYTNFPAILRLALSGPGAQTLLGHTTLSDALSALPVLGYIGLLISNDFAFVILLLLAGISVRSSIVSKKAPSLLPCMWLLSLLFVAPLNENAWRFSYEALVPLTIMAGYGISLVLPRRITGSGKGQKLIVALILILLLSPMVVGSWGQREVTDALTDTGTWAKTEQEVYSAMYWLKNSTPADSRYLSVTDWRFLYTDLILGRATNYTYTPEPSNGLTLANQDGDQFIVVAYYVTPPSNLSSNSFQQYTLFSYEYQGSPHLSLVFSNDDVRVFEVVK